MAPENLPPEDDDIIEDFIDYDDADDDWPEDEWDDDEYLDDEDDYEENSVDMTKAIPLTDPYYKYVERYPDNEDVRRIILLKHADPGLKGLCSFGCGELTDIHGPCHARANQWFKEEGGADKVVYSLYKRFRGYTYPRYHNPDPDTKPYEKMFIEWMVNEGPFHEAFIIKDVDFCYDLGFLIKPQNARGDGLSTAFAACIQTRFATEYPDNFLDWVALVQAGVNKTFAFYLAHCFLRINDTEYKLVVYGPDGHKSMSCNLTKEDLLHFLKGEKRENATGAFNLYDSHYGKYYANPQRPPEWSQHLVKIFNKPEEKFGDIFAKRQPGTIPFERFVEVVKQQYEDLIAEDK